MQTTTNYGLKKPEGNEFISIADLNENADKVDEVLKGLDEDKVDSNGGDIANTKVSEFAANSTQWPIPAVGESPKTLWGKVKKFTEDFKNWMSGVCLIGQIVNNCVTNNPNLPLSAAQGKALMDLYTVLNTKLSGKANSGHTHDDRYYTESEINSRLSRLLHAETIIISPTMAGVTYGATRSLAKSGYTPVAIAGWEIGSNVAVFIQRCEIINQELSYTLRTTSNTSFSGEVFFDVTILYKKN